MLEFLVKPGTGAILEDQVMTVSGWTLEVSQEPDFWRAVYRRAG